MDVRGRQWALLCLVLVMLAGCAKTLAHDGGVRLTFAASCLPAEPRCDVGGKLASILDILKRRGIDGLQVPDTVVRQEGEGRIVIELPGYLDVASARSVLGTRGELVMVDTSGQAVAMGTSILVNGVYQYPVIFNGTQLDLSLVESGLDPQSSQPIVTFGFAGDAKRAFGEYTRAHIGNYLTIALDGRVIESAVIQSEIDGQGQITGLGSLKAAHILAAQLKSGPLPLQLTEVRTEQIMPG